MQRETETKRSPLLELNQETHLRNDFICGCHGLKNRLLRSLFVTHFESEPPSTWVGDFLANKSHPTLSPSLHFLFVWPESHKLGIQRHGGGTATRDGSRSGGGGLCCMEEEHSVSLRSGHLPPSRMTVSHCPLGSNFDPAAYPSDPSLAIHKLVLRTHTSESFSNFLMVANALLPSNKSETNTDCNAENPIIPKVEIT